ncbi:uncharacterized protein LOC119664302 [Teleopsis dalmanni]|uniref:uncharacterized protein LOC119664302 n=1 Tax=Teleopsis dalmanni TaxID=139649 RepID=UPI0018CEF2D0|nr:uncharacterized protein LOC119664302 [Teleopsis dalmanni]
MINQIDHRNSFRYLQRTIAYVRRVFHRTQSPTRTLSPKELRDALVFIIKTIQGSEFAKEISDLKQCKAINSSSQLNTLAPFIDEQGVLRVGGRLEASTLPYDAKHPMVIPYNHSIVKLMFKMKHEENSHCAPQLLLSIMRQNFWPIKGKIMARNIVHSCVICSKAKPKLMDQLMGNLPTDRVTLTKPFFTTGVDYCGPIWIHYKIRGKKPTKAYLAVFCCFATKTVHLEVVSDQSTIYSENGKEKIIKTSSNKGIDFKFIPPRAPHFEGLWEAAVKSAKHLMIKGIFNASLTYEELTTVITEIKAMLNSRPITKMSSDPNDLTALTPGHFLIGEPPTTNVDPYQKESRMSLSSRWRIVSELKQEFWRRWSKEYLNELQSRYKWKQQKANLCQGNLVIIKDDNLPMYKWPLGRVQQVYEGEDGLVRVADIKTANGIFKRPLRSLAPYPLKTALIKIQQNKILLSHKQDERMNLVKRCQSVERYMMAHL